MCPALLYTSCFQDAHSFPRFRLDCTLELDSCEFRPAYIGNGVDNLQDDRTSRTRGGGGDNKVRDLGAGEETGREMVTYVACVRGSYGVFGSQPRVGGYFFKKVPQQCQVVNFFRHRASAVLISIHATSSATEEDAIY
jgi:hypothetical protein